MESNSNGEFTVRRMMPDEISLIREWATGEGWNPGLHDGACFYDTDPDGFFLGVLADEPVACISCVAYGDKFGFLGQYIVRPGFRGRGYGLQMWQAGMKHLGHRNVGLDGVVAQQENYCKSGFRFAQSHIRYRTIGGGERASSVVALSEVAFDELINYDRQCFPAPRNTFLRGWVALPGGAAFGCMNGGRLVGYGCIRPSVEGYKIGPLFADDTPVADDLFRSLLAHAVGQPVVIDVPDEGANANIRGFVQRWKMIEVFRTARMYTGDPPHLRLDKVYGATSLELG